MARELIKWSQFPGISSLQDEINRTFERFWRDWDVPVFGRGGLMPPVNVSETGDQVIVKAEIPGIDPKEVDISIRGDSLLIKGEKKEEKEEKGKTFHRVESRYGSFSRTVALPATIDTDKVNAEYKNGVLEITMQKREEAKQKQIKVKVE